MPSFNALHQDRLRRHRARASCLPGRVRHRSSFTGGSGSTSRSRFLSAEARPRLDDLRRRGGIPGADRSGAGLGFLTEDLLTRALARRAEPKFHQPIHKFTGPPGLYLGERPEFRNFWIGADERHRRSKREFCHAYRCRICQVLDPCSFIRSGSLGAASRRPAGPNGRSDAPCAQ